MALQSLEVWISELGASLAILESHLPILCVFCGFPLGEGNGTPLQQAAVHGVAKSQTRLSDFSFTFHFHALEKERAPPLQCSCLENPRDGGAWWTAVHGVAQSRTLLK